MEDINSISSEKTIPVVVSTVEARRKKLAARRKLGLKLVSGPRNGMSFMERAKDLYTQGVEYMRGKEYIKAIQHFSASSFLFDQDSRVFINRASCYRAIGDFEEVFFDLTTSLEMDESAHIRSQRATAAMKMGALDLALEDMNECLRGGRNINYLFTRSKLYHQLHLPSKALQDLTDCLGMNPDLEMKTSILATKARIHSWLEEWGEAEETLQEALKLSPRNPSIHSALSSLQLKTNQLPEALASINEAVKLKKGNLQFILERAEILRVLGKGEDSIADLTSAIQLLDQDLLEVEEEESKQEEASKARREQREEEEESMKSNKDGGSIEGIDEASLDSLESESLDERSSLAARSKKGGKQSLIAEVLSKRAKLNLQTGLENLLPSILADISRSCLLQPLHPVYHHIRGLVLVFMRRIEEAVVEFEEVVLLHNDIPISWNLILDQEENDSSTIVSAHSVGSSSTMRAIRVIEKVFFVCLLNMCFHD